MIIRPMKSADVKACLSLVHANWGFEAALRAEDQMSVYFDNDGRLNDYAPRFIVATLDGGEFLGFAAYEANMLMKGSFALIWIAVHPAYQKSGAGRALTEYRLDEIRKRGGQMVTLVTQKPDYFGKFGFFKLHHIGNEWYLMLKLFKTVEI
jgi:N-acetylglutamate synthase-like GNAT family acetyltransferase